jgi:hypothetical protein
MCTKRSVTFLAAAITAVGFGVTNQVGAAILYVPGNYSTIQKAIDNAKPYDKIVIGPQAYNESVIITKPNLTIQAADPNARPTICGVGDQAMTIKNGANSTIIDGVQILARYEGVLIEQGVYNPIIRNCSFGQLTSKSYAGIHDNGSSYLYIYKDVVNGHFTQAVALGNNCGTTVSNSTIIGTCYSCTNFFSSTQNNVQLWVYNSKFTMPFTLHYFNASNGMWATPIFTGNQFSGLYPAYPSTLVLDGWIAAKLTNNKFNICKQKAWSLTGNAYLASESGSTFNESICQ